MSADAAAAAATDPEKAAVRPVAPLALLSAVCHTCALLAACTQTQPGWLRLSRGRTAGARGGAEETVRGGAECLRLRAAAVRRSQSPDEDEEVKAGPVELMRQPRRSFSCRYWEEACC